MTTAPIRRSTLPAGFNRRLVIITDVEPDDRVALHLFASHFKPEQIALVGTTVMQAARKQALTRRLMDQLGMASVPVYQGSGGTADSYPPTLSSLPMRTYDNEGEGILSTEQLDFVNKQPESSWELKHYIKAVLQGAQKGEVDFAVLTLPTDLAAVLRETPELKEKIGEIYIMGGWIGGRTTYNWNMDPAAAQDLLQMGVPTLLFSSHLIKPAFNGGAISADNYPAVITAMEQAAQALISVRELFAACKSWNEHFLAKGPAHLARIYGPRADRYFVAADALVAAAMISDKVVKAVQPVSIWLDIASLDQNGCRVNVIENNESTVKLVAEIDPAAFERTVIDAFAQLPGMVGVERRSV